MTHSAYNWVQKVEEILTASKQFPVLEESFPFPWKDLEGALKHVFKLSEITLSPNQMQWKMGHEIISHFGTTPLIFSLALMPLETPFQLIFSEEDASALTAIFLTTEPKTEGFSDPRLQEGFTEFLLLQALSALDSLELFKEMELRLLGSSQPLTDRAFCMDIGITLSGKTIYGRVALPDSFLTQFKAQVPLQKPPLQESLQAKEIDVSLRLECGSLTLNSEEWKQILIGDYLILDHCSYDPKTEKGSISVLLNNTPILMAKVRPDEIKVLDYAYYGEENVEEESEFAEAEVEQIPPMNLSVEVGRLHMNLFKLLQLQPGSVLDLAIRPQQTVDLTLHGKKVARGELLKLGETFGVRILEI